MKKGTIDIITLGCSKNLVDAERLMRQLEVAGWKCVHDSENPQGEIAIVNTCGFIGDAKEESINMILELVERKKKRKLKKIFVMGCLSERYLAELEAEIPEVDGWVGKFNYLDIIQMVMEPEAPVNSADAQVNSADAQVKKGCAPYERMITTPSHYAYLKISEGCNRYCSYCAIPYITGPHKPRPMAEILDEVRWLVSKGVKEINVIAQDLSAYKSPSPTLPEGREKGLSDLVDAMAEIPGVEWIRLHYAYPTDFPYDLLPVMAKHKNVCKYLDIALQHSSDKMLELMRRHITCREQDELIARIRREVPGIVIRTTLIVGHPGETEEDFQEMKAWVERMRFDRMGCFAYSHEDGTYSYKHYTDDIPEEVKQRRVEELMAVQQEISRQLLAEKCGTIERVIIDRKDGDYYIGRTQYDSPEVDCEVLISPSPTLPKERETIRIGEMYDVRITRTEEFDLYGEIV